AWPARSHSRPSHFAQRRIAERRRSDGNPSLRAASVNASSYLLIYTFVLGACIGSFLNVCIVRWPEERSILRPRSRCPRCGNQLSWVENIPVVSWLLLRGRCKCCDEGISVMYPLVELTVAFGWMLAAERFGFTFTAFRVAVFGTTLLGVAITDAKHYLIP